jgi:hypothetical protein
MAFQTQRKEVSGRVIILDYLRRVDWGMDVSKYRVRICAAQTWPACKLGGDVRYFTDRAAAQRFYDAVI